VEAAGVELFGVLITRKLLILGIAKTATKAPLPDPFVRLLYENAFRSRFPSIDIASSIPQIFPEYSHFAEEPFGRDWSGHLTNQPMGAGMVSLVSRPTVRYRWLGFPREEEQL